VSTAIYIFAGGGTGGHLYPGIAVAQELLEADAAARIVFACSDRKIDRDILEPTGLAFVPQPVRPLPARPGQAPGFLWSWLRSAALARDLIRDLRPKAVLGLGGFAAGPVLVRAAGKVRSALLNPDAVPGKANLHLAGKVQAVFSQFECTASKFPPRLASIVRPVGCPIRRGLLGADRAEAAKFFDLSEELRTVLVLGGSMGAASINTAMFALAGRLDELAEAPISTRGDGGPPGIWQLLHVTGPSGEPEGERAYAGKRFRRRVLGYCHRMDLAYALADLAVCRGGASTIAELAATATPAIVVPYPHHRDRQQTLNAEAMVQAGAGLCVQEEADPAATAEALAGQMIGLMNHPARLEGMRRAASGLGRPDAARQVAHWLAGG